MRRFWKYRPGETLITILHTNDTHSQIDPLPANDRQYPDKGGVARRATLVKRIRKENPNTLMIDAGDVFQGTPYFNFYKGEVEYKSMSLIGYDVVTLGNHDFDNGVDALAAAMKFANFDFVSSNYDVRGTPLESRVKPYAVRVVGGVRVGLFGMGVSPDNLITPENFKGVKYNDPVKAARDVVAKLRGSERCKLVVGMSHLGYYPNAERRWRWRLAGGGASGWHRLHRQRPHAHFYEAASDHKDTVGWQHYHFSSWQERHLRGPR